MERGKEEKGGRGEGEGLVLEGAEENRAGGSGVREGPPRVTPLPRGPGAERRGSACAGPEIEGAGAILLGALSRSDAQCFLFFRAVRVACSSPHVGGPASALPSEARQGSGDSGSGVHPLPRSRAHAHATRTHAIRGCVPATARSSTRVVRE